MINDGDFVILKRDSFMRVVQAKRNGRPIIFERVKFYLDNIFGQPYGSSFEVDKASNKLLLRSQEFSVEEALPDTSSGQDNRNLVSANSDNQSLGKDEIIALRKDGLTGDELMTELIKNSTTFSQKTKFSQEKWIKKKKKRHMNIYTILKPCTRLIAELYYNKDPQKLCFLRMDTLAQMLSMGNIQAKSQVLLVESCQGLVTGAILDRLGDGGCLTQLFTGPNPMKGRAAFDDYGFSKELQKTRMKLYPLNLSHELSVFASCCKSQSSKDIESTVEEPSAKKLKKTVEVCEDTPVVMPLSADSENVATIRIGCSSQLSTSDEKSKPTAKNLVKQEPINDSANDNGSKINTQMDSTPTNVAGELSAAYAAPTSDKKLCDGEKLIKDESNGVDTSGIRGAVSSDSVERVLPAYLIERNAAKEYINATKFDTLVVAVKSQPTQLVLRLLDLVKLSRPLVVYHQHKEPLMELFVQLKERGGVVNLKLSESWYREIQVLPERTHPAVNMSGNSGYLLTGTTVER